MFRNTLITVAVLVSVALPAAGKAAPEKKTKKVPLKVTVVSVTGVAHCRLAADDKGGWRQIKAGDSLDELTIIRTGLGAKVVLRFSDRGDATVRSATKIGIREFRKRGKHVTTRLGLKYGSMRAKVDSSRGTNDFRVKMAVATLSVRGTGGNFGFFGDFGMGMNSTDGKWNAGNTGGRDKDVGEGEQTNDDLDDSGDMGANDRDTQMGDPNGGTTGNERNNYRDNGGGRGHAFMGGGNTNNLGSTANGGNGHTEGNGNGNGEYP